MIIGAHISGDPLTAIKTAKQLGLKAVQCFISDGKSFRPDFYEPSYTAEFKQLKVESGIKVAAHGPYIINCCNPSGKLYHASIKACVDYLICCEKLGIDYLVLHPGSCKDDGIATGNEALIAASKQIAHALEINDMKVVLLWENTAGGGTQLGKVDNLSHVLTQVDSPYVRMCLDTTHSFADGHDLTLPEYRNYFWARYGHLTKWVHFNNPNPKVNLGSHLDRHSLPWNQCKWAVDTMLDIAREWGPSNIPMVMEADESAYELNTMFLDEAGLL